MPGHHSLKPRKFQIELRTSETSSVRGDQPAISGLLRQSGFRDWITDYRALDHRKDSSRRLSPRKNQPTKILADDQRDPIAFGR